MDQSTSLPDALSWCLASVHGERFARVKVPPTLPRLIPVPVAPATDGTPQAIAFVWIEQVIAAHLSMLFRGFEVWESYPFRVLRDADIELQEDEASDLLEYIEQELLERRFGSVSTWPLILLCPHAFAVSSSTS